MSLTRYSLDKKAPGLFKTVDGGWVKHADSLPMLTAIEQIKTSAQFALTTGAEFDLQRCVALCERALAKPSRVPA